MVKKNNKDSEINDNDKSFEELERELTRDFNKRVSGLSLII